MNMGDRIYRLRKDKGLTLEYVGKFVGVAKSTVRKWEHGDIESIRSDNIQRLADILGTTFEYLMDGVAEQPAYKNIEALPKTKRVPVIGRIACGEPVLADEHIEDWTEVACYIKADFALRCVGDSMINARIFDGDFVFIRQQADVDNGEIAAVAVDGEATLKRVYKYPNRIELRPENPLFPVLSYEGSKLEAVRILGKAVGFFSHIR